MLLKVQFDICCLEILDYDCVLESSGGFKNIANSNTCAKDSSLTEMWPRHKYVLKLFHLSLISGQRTTVAHPLSVS